jgi:opine dehydrogenase
VHDPARSAWLERTKGTFVATGAMEGRFSIASHGDDPKAFAASVETIFFATVVPAYPRVVRMLAPFLRDTHRIVLFSSKLCGSVHVSAMLAEQGAPRVPVVETDALFACRIFEDDSLFVLGV